MSQDVECEKVIDDMNAFITETKVLLEKVMKMRVQSKEMQVKMLRLFHPSCLKTLQTLNEVSLRNFKHK